VLLALDAAWTANRYPYPLALASAVAVSTLEFTRSLVEWMGEGIASRQQQQQHQGGGQGQQQQDHAASLRAVRPCHSVGDVARLPRGPKVVVASLSSLDAGVARELLVEWAGNPNCAVVFPGQPPRGTLAERLVEGESWLFFFFSVFFSLFGLFFSPK
jgi:cleavage and polyadenylation specificity factor subunit 2